MPYCLLSIFSDAVVPNILSKSLLGRNGCSYIRIIFQKLTWVVMAVPIFNALAKQSLKDLLLLYADHKVD